MRMQARFLLVGASMALGLFAASLPAAAQSTAMQSCSDDWAKMKSAGSVPEGQTWPKFWSQCAKDYAAANPAEDAAPAAKATTSKAAKAKPAAEPAASTGGKSTAMATCSAQWAQMKDAGSMPAGQTWPKFWSQCAKDYAAANPAEDAAPAAKATSKAAKAKPAAEPAASTDGKSTAMATCSAQWAQMKDAGSIPAGQTWPKFWSQCAKDYAAANPSEDAAPAAKATSKAAKAKPAAEPAASTGGKSTAMATCSAQWAQMKEAGSIPAGQTWPKFWSQCAKDYAAANSSEDAAPAKTTRGKAAAATVEADEGIALPDPEQAAKMNTAAKTVGKRPLTPGQQAAIVRIRACGAEWQQRKAAGRLPQGAKWPQYWSDCNKRLKAQGQ